MSDGTVKIAFAGDVYLGSAGNWSLDPELRKILEACDYVVANCEAPLTHTDPDPQDKILLRGDPNAALALRDWGVSAVSLANNHMFDCGIEGARDTLAVLDNCGIAVAGIGPDVDSAAKPVVFEKNGVRIALLACADARTEARIAAAQDWGCLPLDASILDRVRHLSGQGFQVIVMPHWGLCDYTLPPPDVYALGDNLVEAGATAVVGHHSHVVQGLRIRDRRLVAYSLGNFAFAPYRYRETVKQAEGETARGMVLRMTLDRDGVKSYEIFPTLQRGEEIVPQADHLRADVIEQRSAMLGAGEYAASWKRIVRKRLMRRLLYWLNPLRWRHVGGDQVRGALIMAGNVIPGRRKDR